MNKSTLKKLIESLTDEVIAEKKLEEAGVKPKDLKPGTEYTYTGGAVNFTAKFVGFDQNKDKLKPYTFDYKGKKLQLSAPEVMKFVEADLDEKTIISSTDGTEKTLSADQKKKVQIASDAGEDVKIKKKGMPLAENEIEPGQPTEINVAEAIDSAISSLSQTSESTENATYKRLAEKTLRILNTAKEAYSKLAEKMSLDEEKDTDKHVDHVRKHLTKKIKDKKDIEPIMKKYAPVIKKIKGQVADPAKAAEHVWKHILKEGISLKEGEDIKAKIKEIDPSVSFSPGINWESVDNISSEANAQKILKYFRDNKFEDRGINKYDGKFSIRYR